MKYLVSSILPIAVTFTLFLSLAPRRMRLTEVNGSPVVSAGITGEKTNATVDLGHIIGGIRIPFMLKQVSITPPMPLISSH